MPGRFASILVPGQYLDHKLAALNGPEPDFLALARALRDPEIGNFDHVDVTVGRPGEEVRSRIVELFHFRKPYDFLLLYYAGVGLLEGAGGLYLAAADTLLDSPGETAIAADFINEWMDRSFARRKLLVLDCPFADLGSEIPGAPVDAGAAFEGSGRWRMVLAAQGVAQYALVNDNLVGTFRDATFGAQFLRGLETGDADLDGNGLISVREIFAYVNERSEKLPLAQRPQLWTFSGRDKFIVAAVPERDRKRGAIKWDLALGALLVPAVTLLLGWQAERPFALGVAVFFLLLYGALYVWGD